MNVDVIDLALDNKIFVSDKLNAALQELDMLFNTTNTELIGHPKYGTNFESFLWQMTPSPNALKSYIEDKIKNFTLFCQEYDIVVEVEIVPGEYRSIYNVVIALRTDPNSRNALGFRVYQLR